MSYWIWFPGDFEIRHGLKAQGVGISPVRRL